MSKYAPSKGPDYILSEEAAAEQIQQVIDYYDIDPSKLGDAADSYEIALDALVDAIRRGVLEVTRGKDDKLEVKHNLKSGDVITYGEVNAKAKLAMDKFSRQENYRRLYAFMGSLCGLGSAGIEKLPARDLSLVELLGTVFSNV